MLSVLTAVLFHCLAASWILHRCRDTSTRIIFIGSSPIAWLAFLGLAGLLDTLLGIPAWFSVWGTLAVAIFAVIRNRQNLQSALLTNDTWYPGVAVCVFGLCAIATGLRMHLIEPYGGWDAIFTWVLRARFFLLGGNQWSNAFSIDLALLHPDYPPLLGWALYALWRVDGDATSLATFAMFAPMWLGFALVVLGFPTIWTEQFRLKLSTAVAVTAPLVWKVAGQKLSDFALVYAICLSCALFGMATHRRSLRIAMAAGFVAALSALIKNEGLTWCFNLSMVSALYSLFTRGLFGRRFFLAMIAGALLPFAATLLFKYTLAVPNDLIAPTRTFQIGQVVQPGIMNHPVPLVYRIGRMNVVVIHDFLLARFGNLVWNWMDFGIGIWLIFGLLIGRLMRPLSFPLPFLAILMQLGIYYTIYLITPYQLDWHVASSLDRIMTHLIPASLCLLGGYGNIRPLIDSRGMGPFSRKLIDGQWAVPCAATYLITISLANVYLAAIETKSIDINVDAMSAELKEIGFPQEKRASYVSSELSTQDLYSTQFQAVPTILLVDRREPILLARFANEQALRDYCETHQWRLENHRDGFGWARDDGGEELEQVIKLERPK